LDNFPDEHADASQVVMAMPAPVTATVAPLSTPPLAGRACHQSGRRTDGDEGGNANRFQE
jgi:hypothetical protein